MQRCPPKQGRRHHLPPCRLSHSLHPPSHLPLQNTPHHTFLSPHPSFPHPRRAQTHLCSRGLGPRFTERFKHSPLPPPKNTKHLPPPARWRARQCLPRHPLQRNLLAPCVARAWVRACDDLWQWLFSPSFKNPILKRAIVADILLSLGPPSDPRLRPQHRTPNPATWSGAWLRTLTWLSAAPGDGARHILTYLSKLPEAHAGGAATLAALPPLHAAFVLHAFDAVLDARLAKGGAGSARAEYLAHFCPRQGEWHEDPGFNALLPPLYRRTGRFHKLEHAKALMCVRCVAYPLRACPTSFPRGDLSCRRCGAAGETLEHVSFECEHSKSLRDSDRFSPLLATLPHQPPQAATPQS